MTQLTYPLIQPYATIHDVDLEIELGLEKPSGRALQSRLELRVQSRRV